MLFPPSLHKNIQELDKQISLLEADFESMETDKKKRVTNGKPLVNKSSKLSNSYLKSPPVKDVSNKPLVTGPGRVASAGFSRKVLAPPPMMKWSSTSSVPCKDGCRKSCSGRVESPLTEIGLQKMKFGKSQSSIDNEKGKIEGKKGKCNCPCSKRRSAPPEPCKELIKYQQGDCENLLLHKEVLCTNPGSTIEVTVTRKTGKSQSSNDEHPQKKYSSLIKENGETNSEKSECSCGKGNKEKVNGNGVSNGLKWSEILNQSDGGKKSGRSDDGRKINDNLLPKLQCYYVKPNPVEKNYNQVQQNKNGDVEGSQNQRLKSLNGEPTKENDWKKCKEQEVQCLLWDVDPKKCEENIDLYNPIRNLHYLISELKRKQSDEEMRTLINNMENAVQKIYNERSKKAYSSSSQTNKENEGDDKDIAYVTYLQMNYSSVKKLCDNLTIEKEELLKKLSEKDKVILSMKNEERKYMSLISSLKDNLEKSKKDAEDSVQLLQELNIVKNKLLEETKVADALRKSHSKMQERVQQCVLENDKLKTQLRMKKLEAQKFNVLLAGKDAEIKRYKEEIESFQKQISEQLAILRSNAAMAEVEKAMESIMHQSYLFSQTDIESVLTESHNDKRPKSSSTNRREKLMHSSPTTTKTSVLDSSWNQISSIYGEDPPEKDSVILMPTKTPPVKESSKKENKPQATSSKHFSVYSPRLKDITDKKDPSFTSCKSKIDFEESENVREANDSDSGVTNDESTLRSDFEGKGDGLDLITKDTKKFRSNIENLFRDYRLKLKEKVQSTRNNFNYEDDFGDCPLSDLSQGSVDLSATLSDLESMKGGRRSP